ncbi:acyl-CoA-binding domain-containing protein 4 [Linnemannia schmuckeri]|uniref:Acyl-CoA-binding domain-containing protein 4 n=1 Tax=Linnemannia schmuckeri TaxID=64567 RepID=A0A9P5VEC8_9FUNG|nr:acyl-CoA-binding domain-containing protein 4 [Linnemannia schmuckeri]
MKRPRLARNRSRIILYLTFSFSISSSLSSSLTDAIVIPPARWGHVSVLCGNQLYIHGGHTGVNPMTAPVGSDLYSLDISTTFNSFTVPWAQLTAGPYASFHTAGLLGPSNNLLAVFGGNTSFSSSPSSNSNSLNLYDTASGTWVLSPLQDPPRREQAAAVSRLSDGTMYVMGGMVLSPDLRTESATAELWSIGGYITPPTNTTGPGDNSTSPDPPKPTQPPGLTPQTVGWQKLTSPNSPSGADRSFHTATMIRSNGLIVLIGGVSGGALVPMSEIAVYDTAAGTWSVQTATGATPPLRRNHIAVATNNGQIYVHGGTDLGATTFFADLAILDTTSWSWSQPAMGGNAPTGRYSHAATMVGSNIIMTFGLTAGGSNNNIFILDTTTNAWVTSYTPNALAQTSTKPEDWPGYKPPPVLPSPSPEPNDPQPTSPDNGKNEGPDVAAIVGGLVGSAALAVVLVVAMRRRRRQQIQNTQHKATALYASDYSYARNPHLEDAYRPTGMAFDSAPLSFGQRVKQAWSGIGFRHGSGSSRRAANVSYSQRLGDRDEDDGGMRGLQTLPYPSDQEIFLDAVHRARSRAGHLSPLFTPLQQPISQSPPTSPRSPRSSAGFGNTGVGAGPGSGPGVHYSGPGVTLTDARVPRLNRDGEEAPHGRAYSDGFENAMQEMDIQMLAVPRGRLYVVNPSDESLGQDHDHDSNQGQDQGHSSQEGLVQGGEDPYRQFDSQSPEP